MSLAIYAAPFNNDNNNEDYNSYNPDTPINRKRTANNRTQKRIPTKDYNPQKVNSVLESLHSMPSNETNSLGDFDLIPPPSSSGVENTKFKENTTVKEGMTNQNKMSYAQINDNDYETDDVDIQSLNNNYMSDKVVEKYYKNLIPTYNDPHYKKSENNKPYYAVPNIQNTNSNGFESDNYRLLTDKLNYMINLLEEQQDEKTNNVTEEVVLYSFLGIFIIFVVDSFARVGKYVR